MLDNKPTIAYLKQQLENKLILSETGRYFLPTYCLSLIFSPQEITKAINELSCQAYERIGLSEKIHQEGLRVFAILIKNGKEESVVAFRRHGMLDARLPLSEDSARLVLGADGISFAREHQWQFLPYHFAADMRDYPLHIHEDAYILPFLAQPEFVGGGASGDVYKLKIPPSQQSLVPEQLQEACVIRKRIRSKSTDEGYQKAVLNEHWCLVLLARLNHPNIVPLLASYTHQGLHNFLFPSYDRDLARFLNSESREGDFKYDFTFYSALQGLASALSSTHNLHLEQSKHGLDYDAIGYHHDLRPANVLVSDNTFILADFGLGKFKSSDLPSQTQWKIGHGDYLAPECEDDEFVHLRVGRGIDVWAFGCIALELIIYMTKGAAGLQQFRRMRNSPSRHKNWNDSYFYGKDGNIKAEVQEWLSVLLQKAQSSSPITMLVQLCASALKRNPEERPKIADICTRLAFVSLRAHFSAVSQAFSDCPNYTFDVRGSNGIERTMSKWFDRQKFFAFGLALGIQGHRDVMQHRNEISRIHNEASSVMVNLYRSIAEESRQKSPKESIKSIGASEASYSRPRDPETRVAVLINSLWSLLPPTAIKEAEMTWLNSILGTEDINYLSDLETCLKIEDTPLYEKGAAVAAMKRVRLEMLSNPENMPPNVLLSRNDVQFQKVVDGHSICLLRGSLWVLVEWMFCSPAWSEATAKERTIVMGLRAQCFNAKPKPLDLRILDCVGVFESTDEEIGYGFVYQIPYPMSKTENAGEIPVHSLLQILKNSYSNPRKQWLRPLLQDKFLLSSMVCKFLVELHSIGWLHENINSHNILLFGELTDSRAKTHLPSELLRKPYIVGLHKSRPGGKAWHTDGPGSGAVLQDYQHPDYASMGRYQMAYDYYSLGLVLLEIGLWRPLASWSEKYDRLDLEELRRALITRCVPRLGLEMGTIYQDVVEFCLQISSDGAEGKEDEQDSGALSLELVMEKIVEPLDRLATLIV